MLTEKHVSYRAKKALETNQSLNRKPSEKYTRIQWKYVKRYLKNLREGQISSWTNYNLRLPGQENYKSIHVHDITMIYVGTLNHVTPEEKAM